MKSKGIIFLGIALLVGVGVYAYSKRRNNTTTNEQTSKPKQVVQRATGLQNTAK